MTLAIFLLALAIITTNVTIFIQTRTTRLLQRRVDRLETDRCTSKYDAPIFRNDVI